MLVHIFTDEIINGIFYRFYVLDLTQSLTDNLKGKILIEFPILRVVVDPSRLGEFPLVGSGPPVKAGSRKSGGEPAAKKSKLTFYEVSDGELSDSD